MHLEVGQSVEGTGGSQQQHQPTSLCPGYETPFGSHPISGTLNLWKSSIVKVPGLGAGSKLPTSTTACFVKIFTQLQST